MTPIFKNPGISAQTDLQVVGEMSVSKDHLSALPRELLAGITVFLGKKDLAAMERLNKRIKDLLNFHHCWKLAAQREFSPELWAWTAKEVKQTFTTKEIYSIMLVRFKEECRIFKFDDGTVFIDATKIKCVKAYEKTYISISDYPIYIHCKLKAGNLICTMNNLDRNNFKDSAIQMLIEDTNEQSFKISASKINDQSDPIHTWLLKYVGSSDNLRWRSLQKISDSCPVL